MPSSARKHRRFELNLRVDCLMEDTVFSDFSRNLSEGGICVSSLLPVREGADVELKFSLPDSHREPVALRGKVIWCKAEGENYPMGIKFVDSPPGEDGVFA